jgi:hypothetical protein
MFAAVTSSSQSCNISSLELILRRQQCHMIELKRKFSFSQFRKNFFTKIDENSGNYAKIS